MFSDIAVHKSLEGEFSMAHDQIEGIFLKRMEETYEECKASPAGVEWLDKIRKARFFPFHLMRLIVKESGEINPCA
jgi:hypothetical protein